VAYPLARRAYESLSLLVACVLEPKLADRWIAGTQIGNAEVRRVLAAHPMGEKETQTRELYDFFSKSTHPNRNTIAYRFLGEGNEFVLGAIGTPSLALLTDYALKTLNLWFWFAAFVVFTFREVLSRPIRSYSRPTRTRLRPRNRLRLGFTSSSVAFGPKNRLNSAEMDPNKVGFTVTTYGDAPVISGRLAAAV
jgi:hypothetical protein